MCTGSIIHLGWSLYYIEAVLPNTRPLNCAGKNGYSHYRHWYTAEKSLFAWIWITPKFLLMLVAWVLLAFTLHTATRRLGSNLALPPVASKSSNIYHSIDAWQADDGLTSYSRVEGNSTRWFAHHSQTRRPQWVVEWNSMALPQAISTQEWRWFSDYRMYE